MTTQASQTTREIPEGRLLSEDEDRVVRENLARENFGMSLDEFIEAQRIDHQACRCLEVRNPYPEGQGNLRTVRIGIRLHALRRKQGRFSVRTITNT